MGKRRIIGSQSGRSTQKREIGQDSRRPGSQSSIPAEISVITIADREADIYELFAHPRREGSELIIRASHNRKIEKASGEIEKLFEAVKLAPVCGEKELELQRTPRRKARKAKLSIRFKTVELKAPKGKEEISSGIVIQAVLAEESEPPEGEKAVSWLILTTLKISNKEEAEDCLEKYSYRWLIERFHYVLKSGCKVEELQLETGERMEKALLTYSIVAWRLLWLTYEARKNPERELKEILEEKES